MTRAPTERAAPRSAVPASRRQRRVMRLLVTGLKGGIGKTTVTLQLAAAYARAGYRVLVLDVDPQSSSTFYLTGQAEPNENHVGTLLATFSQHTSPRSRPQLARELFDAAVLRLQDPSTPMISPEHRAAWGKVDLLPGHTDCAWLTFTQNHLQDLNLILSAVESDYDVVLLDAAPSAWSMTLVGLYAATSFLAITTPTAMSLNGINQLFGLVARIEKFHPSLKPMGVVLNKYRRRYREHNEHRSSLEAQLGDFLLKPYLELHTEVEKAEGAHLPLHAMPGDVAKELSEAFDDLSRTLMNKEAA